MTTAELKMPTPVNFTDNAVNKVKALIEEEGTPDLSSEYSLVAGDAQVSSTDLLLRNLSMMMIRR